jgi:hypothetical protein
MYTCGVKFQVTALAKRKVTEAENVHTAQRDKFGLVEAQLTSNE